MTPKCPTFLLLCFIIVQKWYLLGKCSQSVPLFRRFLLKKSGTLWGHALYFRIYIFHSHLQFFFRFDGCGFGFLPRVHYQCASAGIFRFNPGLFVPFTFRFGIQNVASSARRHFGRSLQNGFAKISTFSESQLGTLGKYLKSGKVVKNRKTFKITIKAKVT